jgi:asparagine synthase (glutamine-hydrolysing)
LNDPAARRRELLRRDYVDNLLANPEMTLTPKRHSKLWQVGLLEFWRCDTTHLTRCVYRELDPY